jgi:hypothetical protein
MDSARDLPTPLGGKDHTARPEPDGAVPVGNPSSRRPVMLSRPDTFVHHPNFILTRPRSSRKPRPAAIIPCGQSPPTQSVPLSWEAPQPKKASLAGPEGPAGLGSVTGQAFAWAIVTGPGVSSTDDPVEGGEASGAPGSPARPPDVQVTKAMAMAMATIRTSLTDERPPPGPTTLSYTWRRRSVPLDLCGTGQSHTSHSLHEPGPVPGCTNLRIRCPKGRWSSTPPSRTTCDVWILCSVVLHQRRAGRTRPAARNATPPASGRSPRRRSCAEA